MLDFQLTEADLREARKKADEAKTALIAQVRRQRAAAPTQQEEVHERLRRTMQNHIKAMEERQNRKKQELQNHRTQTHSGPARIIDNR